MTTKDQPYMQDRYRLLADDHGADYIPKMLVAAQRAAQASGAVSSGKIITGDAWMCLNALDWLVEHKYLVEVTAGKNVAGQDRIYTLGENA